MKFETIVHALAYWAKETPDKTVVIEAETGRKCTYGELWQWSTTFAKKLSNSGVRKNYDDFGSRVVVRVGGLLETMTAQFAIYLVGGVYCPVDKQMKAPKMLEMIDYYDAKVYISAEKLDSSAIWFDLSDIIDSEAATNEITIPKSTDLCAIIFTTGTTGMAKGVMQSHRSLITAAEKWCTLFSFKESDVFIFMHNTDKIAALRFAASSINSGSTFSCMSVSVFINDFMLAAERIGVTKMNLSAPLISLFFRDWSEEKLVLNHIDTLITALGIISVSLVKNLERFMPNAKLFTLYGATEVTAIATYPFSEDLKAPSCVGKPSEGTEIEFLDKNGNIVDATAENLGIVRCKNDTMMLGYWRDEELTSNYMSERGVLMTDLGWRDKDGYIYLAGRRDDVIEIGGLKIAPYEIESVAMSLDEVEECACIGVPDEMFGNIPVLFVKICGSARFNIKSIHQHLANHIETYKLPRRIYEIDEFPRVNNSSKINRREIINYVKKV